MSQAMIKQRVLMVLVENFKKNSNPALVDSDTIASELNMSIVETRRIINSMNGMGVIESNMEGQYSLITRKGMDWLRQVGYESAVGM